MRPACAARSSTTEPVSPKDDRTSEFQRLQVAANLKRFIEEEAPPGSGVDAAAFWSGSDALVARSRAQERRHSSPNATASRPRSTPGIAPTRPDADMAAYKAFLSPIGYLLPVPAGAKANTTNVDDELAVQAGPQLVVPVMNARYALNAANALGLALRRVYGTDAIPQKDGAELTKGYNPARGAKVIAFGRAVLDQAAPLAGARTPTPRLRGRGGRWSVKLKSGASNRPAAGREVRRLPGEDRRAAAPCC